jgi:hypothetical protein
LKGLAHTRIPKGETKPFNKCWYQPIVQDRIADLSYRFTLSQSTTAAIPPGEQLFFWKAMEIENQFQPVSDAEKQELESLATEVQPIFSST